MFGKKKVSKSARLGGKKSPKVVTLPPSNKKMAKVAKKGGEAVKEGGVWKKTKASRSTTRKISEQEEEEQDMSEDEIMSRTIYDPRTGESKVLGVQEVQLIQKLIDNEYADEDYDPYEKAVDFFTHDTMTTPLVVKNSKTASLPSRTEMRQVQRYVRAIRNGRLVLGPQKKELALEDVWEREFEEPFYRRAEYIAAPKMALPTNADSYNPAEEYMREDVAYFKNLRTVPAYDRFLQERFARCLDLYMCARQKRNKLMIDPDSMLPRLPNREELGPFPETKSTEYRNGHDGQEVRMLSVDSQGKWLASVGGEFLTVWEIHSGRAVYQLRFERELVRCVAWRPSNEDSLCLAVGVGEHLHIVTPFSNSKIALGEGELSDAQSIIEWTKQKAEAIPGLQVTLKHPGAVQSVQWHRKGDYLVTVCQAASAAETVALHQLSKRFSQHPFRKLAAPTGAMFSPVRPQLFVSTRQGIRVYDLKEQRLQKRLQAAGAQLTTLPAVHAGGDNLVVGSGDGRLFWFDLDLSSEPYKALLPNNSNSLESVRAVAMHSKLPLFAGVSASTVQILHGGVSEELNKNALIVPLKRIPVEAAGSAVVFHPEQPWMFVGDSLGSITLFV